MSLRQNPQYENSLEGAQNLDRMDPLNSYSSRFHIPQKEGKEVIYLCGNSLGLQPKGTREAIERELTAWQNLAVEGHFQGENPWFFYHKGLQGPLSRLVGAREEEVIAMNSLSANLHFLMVSFYRPTSSRYKILTEGKSFPSDLYALSSQLEFHGSSPRDGLVEVFPRPGEHWIRTEDILSAIESLGEELALISMGGVNYYTGQVFDMEQIARAGRKAGALVAFDLAHGIGNVDLELHNWGVDFGVWCSYKYLNSGPGSVGGAFVHEKHGLHKKLHRFAGWWGHREETRFQMEGPFDPVPGAAGWQLSNAPILSMAAHKAALDIFDEVGRKALGQKRDLLSGYLEFLLEDLLFGLPLKPFEILTPRESKSRGCQFSLLVARGGKELHHWLTQRGVVVDYRNPDVIRMAPVPLYNTFEQVWRTVDFMREFFLLYKFPQIR